MGYTTQMLIISDRIHSMELKVNLATSGDQRLRDYGIHSMELKDVEKDRLIISGEVVHGIHSMELKAGISKRMFLSSGMNPFNGIERLPVELSDDPRQLESGIHSMELKG